MPAKVYTVYGTKGGGGKTTTCGNLSACIADMSQRVLLVDCDPQQSLSRLYQLTTKARYGLTQTFKSASTTGCISNTYIQNLDIILNDDPAGDGVIPNFLRESLYNFYNLQTALDSIKDDYDFIFIDTQGAKSNIQEAAILAADVLLCPVQPKVLDSREFLYGTLEVYKKMQPQPGRPSINGKQVPPLRVLVNMADRTTACGEIITNLRQHFGNEADGYVTVLSSVIPYLNSYALANGAGTPVHRFETSRTGATLAALHIMTGLAHELEPRLSGRKPHWSEATTQAPEVNDVQ